MNDMATTMPDPLIFTESAANKVKTLIEEEGNNDLKLRVRDVRLGMKFSPIVDATLDLARTQRPQNRRDSSKKWVIRLVGFQALVQRL